MRSVVVILKRKFLQMFKQVLAVPDKNMRLLFSLVATLIAIYVVSVIFTTIRSRIMVDVSQNIIYGGRESQITGDRRYGSIRWN